MAELYVGIDVAKTHLDVAVRPTGERWRVTNDEGGIEAIVSRLGAVEPALIVLEATGGYGRTLIASLATASLPVAVVNPRQVRDFARSIGKLARTDSLDAQVLARFGEAVRPEPRPLPDEQARALTAVLERRGQLIAMLVAERNRLHVAAERVKGGIEAHIRRLEEELEGIDRDLDRTSRDSRVPSGCWRERGELLQSVPGVGKVLSTTLLTRSTRSTRSGSTAEGAYPNPEQGVLPRYPENLLDSLFTTPHKEPTVLTRATDPYTAILSSSASCDCSSRSRRREARRTQRQDNPARTTSPNVIVCCTQTDPPPSRCAAEGHLHQ